jgi:hypothetical protein
MENFVIRRYVVQLSLQEMAVSQAIKQEAILLNLEQSLIVSPPKGARNIGGLRCRVFITPPN